jgi:hypothetical protein
LKSIVQQVAVGLELLEQQNPADEVLDDFASFDQPTVQGRVGYGEKLLKLLPGFADGVRQAFNFLLDRKKLRPGEKPKFPDHNSWL